MKKLDWEKSNEECWHVHSLSKNLDVGGAVHRDALARQQRSCNDPKCFSEHTMGLQRPKC